MNHAAAPIAIALVLALAATVAPAQERDAVVVIAHPNVPRIDLATAQRLYSGRAVQVAGVPVVVVNAAPGTRVRERFMATVMNQDDDRYVAYWTVRKHVGKGVPPRELRNAAEITDFVTATPGGVGYVGAAELRPGLNVVLRP